MLKMPLKGMCVAAHRKKHSQTPSPVRRTFEWQLGGMTVSDCGDNGILVSLQIVPQEMAENCFWIKVKEEKFENPDLFAQLSLCFSSQSKGKEASSFSTPSLINQQTYASFSIFSHLKRNCLDTKKFCHCFCLVSVQISMPVRNTDACVSLCLCVYEEVKMPSSSFLYLLFVPTE